MIVQELGTFLTKYQSHKNNLIKNLNQLSRRMGNGIMRNLNQFLKCLSDLINFVEKTVITYRDFIPDSELFTVNQKIDQN